MPSRRAARVTSGARQSRRCRASACRRGSRRTRCHAPASILLRRCRRTAPCSLHRGASSPCFRGHPGHHRLRECGTLDQVYSASRRYNGVDVRISATLAVTILLGACGASSARVALPDDELVRPAFVKVQVRANGALTVREVALEDYVVATILSEVD